MTSLPELTKLFHQTWVAHHRAFASTNGADPDWARWYAEYLVEPLGRELNSELQTDALAKDLASVDEEYRQAAPGVTWTEYYAQWFAHRYSSKTSPRSEDAE